MWKSSVRFCLYHPQFVCVGLLLWVLGGWLVAPVGDLGSPLSMNVNALPDLSENQHIIRTSWPGQSPERIEAQLNYPLSTQLLSVSGVRDVRGQAMQEMSFLYVIFEEDIGFYEARGRLSEVLASLPDQLLPEGLQPRLGPAATALGQVFMYTIEGRGEDEQVLGGWSLEERRRIQDFQIKPALLSVSGVAEVASIGGFERCFEVIVYPLRLRARGISLPQLITALKSSDIEVSAGTLELNEVEYVLQGFARLQRLEDVEQVLLKHTENGPIRLLDIGRVVMSTRPRRAVLDNGGVESVGGVVTMSYGSDARQVLKSIKKKVAFLNHTLPLRHLFDGRLSQLHLKTVYDRSTLIDETLSTLSYALLLQILITAFVVLWMLRQLSTAFAMSMLMPLSILGAFIGMYAIGVEVHIVSLTGIAIAIGTVVDIGILLWDQVARKIKTEAKERPLRELVLEATLEFLPMMRTALGTTLLSFLPIFALEASEGQLMHPLAWTKNLTLVSAFLLSIYVLPSFIYWLERPKRVGGSYRVFGIYLSLLGGGVVLCFFTFFWGSLCCCVALAELLRMHFAQKQKHWSSTVYILWIGYALSVLWMPLGLEHGLGKNLLFLSAVLGSYLAILTLLIRFYRQLLSAAWRYRWVMLGGVLFFMVGSIMAWKGSKGRLGTAMDQLFPGLPKNLMPSLEENSFLLMPIGAPHAGLEAHRRHLQQLDRALLRIPEVEEVVGKIGRAETALDPAPMHMFEILINYASEYRLDKQGRVTRFAVDETGGFLRDSLERLIPDSDGRPYRNWRPSIRSRKDIWHAIQRQQLPVLSAASMLQPIETRRIMLQTGLSAPLALSIRGESMEKMASFAAKAAEVLRSVEGIAASSVYPEPLIGKPYLSFDLRKKKAQQLGLSAAELAPYLEAAIGGRPILYLQEGRLRWPLQLRYGRALRTDLESIAQLPVQGPQGEYLRLGDLVDISYRSGPQMIRSENSWPLTYVLFDTEEGYSAEDVVQRAENNLRAQETKSLLDRPEHLSYEFVGSYKETLRMERKFAWILPLTLLLIWLLLYLQFRKIWLSALVLSSVIISFIGGFGFLWLCQHSSATSWAEYLSIFGLGEAIPLNTVTWVGFIALMGITVDNGVVMGMRLEAFFALRRPTNVAQALEAAYEAGRSRLRACLITTATTLIALLPLLSSEGKGSELMKTIAAPLFGGMLLGPVFLFFLPILYAICAPRSNIYEKP